MCPALTWLVGKLLVSVPYYCMVNILAKKELVPELMQHDFNALNVAARVEYLLDHPERREEMIRGLQALKSRLGQGGAIERAAGRYCRGASIAPYNPKGRLNHPYSTKIRLGDMQRGSQPYNPTQGLPIPRYAGWKNRRAGLTRRSR